MRTPRDLISETELLGRVTINAEHVQIGARGVASPETLARGAARSPAPAAVGSRARAAAQVGAPIEGTRSLGPPSVAETVQGRAIAPPAASRLRGRAADGTGGP